MLEKHASKMGVGDRIVAKGAIKAVDRGETVNFKNGTEMRVERIRDDGRIDVRTLGEKHERAATIDVRQGARIDLAYAQTANQSQGRTVDVVIADMRSTQRNLADQQRMYVALSRAKEQAIVHTDSKAKLAEQVRTHSGQKETAIERDDPRPPRSREERQVGQAGRSHRVGDALRAVGRQAGKVARQAGDAWQRHEARAPLRQSDRTTKKMLRNVNRAAKRQRSAARRTGGLLSPWRHVEVAEVNAKAADARAKIKGQQVATHARWEAREEGKPMEWHDPKTGKQLVRMKNGRTARSTDHGKTWREEKGVKGFLDRRQAKARAERMARIQAAHEQWQGSGGKETMDSRKLATAALESHARDQSRLTPMKPRDWDRLADKYGIEYDKQGHRYAYDRRGHLHSEVLTKRELAINNTAHGREARFATEGHTAGALRGLYARHKVEKAVREGQQREVDRLNAVATERRQLGDIARQAKHEAKPTAGRGHDTQTPAPRKPVQDRSHDLTMS